MQKHLAFIALGANLSSHAGAPAETLRRALGDLARRGVTFTVVSSFYLSPAWPDPNDPPFVNAVARAETELTPAQLLTLLHETETAYGRTRSARNAPRTLDLDLIDFDRRVEPGPPELPHPRLSGRAFVLLPLAEVEPGWIHPLSLEPIDRLIAALPEGDRAATRIVPG